MSANNSQKEELGITKLVTYTAEDTHNGQNNRAQYSCSETLFGAETVRDQGGSSIVVVDGKSFDTS